jgi:hypothetical protein
MSTGTGKKSESKKLPITSKEEAVRISGAANKELLPPDHVPLEQCDMPYFRNVIEEFARAEWTPHQLELAAMLARTMCDLEAAQRDLRTQGAIAESRMGTPVVNPLNTVVQMRTTSIMNFRRTLSLNTYRAQGIPRADVAKTRELGLEIQAGARALSDAEDDLMARPQ